MMRQLISFSTISLTLTCLSVMCYFLISPHSSHESMPVCGWNFLNNISSCGLTRQSRRAAPAHLATC
jgi:hypothetical protein